MSISARLHKLAVRGCLIAGVLLAVSDVSADSEIRDHPKEEAQAGNARGAPSGGNPMSLTEQANSENGDSAVDQKRCAEADKNSEILDPCQQWRMANAAEQQVAASREQNRLTKWEIGFLIGALFVSIAGTIAAGYAVIITRKNAQVELRAYVSLSPGPIQFYPRTNTLVASIVQKNYGSTPAKNVRLTSHLSIMKRPLPQDITLLLPDFDASRNVLPSGVALETRVSLEDLPGHDLPAETLYIAKDGVYVTTAIKYDDVFGRPHKTRACWVYNLEGSFIKAAEHEGVMVPVEYTTQHNDAT